MTSQLKAKLLQHFAGKKNANGGFTLIELLVVIIIIGILSAIALPSFLNQANKARQSEAKTYVGSMNRAQQAYYMENGEFTDGLASLGLGVRSTTDNYSYTITVTTPASAGATGSVATNKATALQDALKAYAGGVALASVGGNANDVTTSAVLCEADDIGKAAVAVADADGEDIYCPANTTEIN